MPLPREIGPGRHILYAEGYDNDGSSVSETVDVVVHPPGTPLARLAAVAGAVLLLAAATLALRPRDRLRGRRARTSTD